MRSSLWFGVRKLLGRTHTPGTLRHASYKPVTEVVLKNLASIVGEGNHSTSAAVRDQHGKDESHHNSLPPDVVVFPTSVQQVQEIARLCHKERIPVIPFGTGTGLEGGVGALMGGVCVDMNKMDAITEVHADDFYATVQPGVTRKALNRYLRDTGLWFPIDPGADASVCGMAATSASGTNAVRYGTMRENVLNLEVVLADGALLHTAGRRGRARKTSAGYNLTNLFVGSEGTLGFITQATLRLYPIPEATMAAVCSFSDVGAAVTTSVQTMQSGVPIARVEFLDEFSILHTNQFSGLDNPVSPTLFMEFTGTERGVEEQVKIVSEIAEDNGAFNFIWKKDHEARAELWKARHDNLYAMVAMAPGKKLYATDICVPISTLPQVIQKTNEIMEQFPSQVTIVGHVGDGNFHCSLMIDPDNQEEIALANQLADEMTQYAFSVGGTCTGEHGVGRGKRELLAEEMGEVGVALMRKLKETLDPHMIMNPGKVLHQQHVT